ncbi:hypothetical protein B4166_0538 [Caldibacillus thermoamylovorans]|nr:hypothetical protein B4166_0538 [Caldibacillus thermoamylovorans]
MATKPILVTIFSRKTPFSAEKLHFLTTRTFLVTIFRRETPFFDDETFSRRHFEPENFFFG